MIAPYLYEMETVLERIHPATELKSWLILLFLGSMWQHGSDLTDEICYGKPAVCSSAADETSLYYLSCMQTIMIKVGSNVLP